MISGMAPSPDWFTGFYTFWMTDEYSRTWYEQFKIQTKPWDAGTDNGTIYLSNDEDTDPVSDISRFTFRNAPPGGELFNSTSGTIPNVAELECRLVVGDNEPFILPDCDWFANPFCNETTAAPTNEKPQQRRRLYLPKVVQQTAYQLRPIVQLTNKNNNNLIIVQQKEQQRVADT